MQGLKLSADVADDSPKGTLAVRDGFVRTKSDDGWLSSADIRDRLFEFSEVTFQPTIVGPVGPSYAQVRSSLPAAQYPWAWDTTLLGVNSGILTFLVPMDGQYRITAQGATRAEITGAGASRLVEVQAVFDLEAGDKLYIVVGQRGNLVNGVYAKVAGGAGGTFVSLNGRTMADLLLVSGGASATYSPAQVSLAAPVPVKGATNLGVSGQYIESQSGSGVWATPANSTISYQGDGASASGSYVYQGISGGGGGARQRSAVGTSQGQAFENGSAGGYASGASQYRANGGFGGGGGNGYPNADSMQGRFVPGSGGYSGGFASGRPQPVNHVGGAGGNFINFAKAIAPKSTTISKTVVENGSCKIELVG